MFGANGDLTKRLIVPALYNLGRTGLKVSRLCLGCMSYGDPARGTHAWTLNDEQSRPFFKKALDQCRLNCKFAS